MGEDRIGLKIRAECGTNRTNTAIHLKRRRLKLLANLDGYSACRLADLLGVDGHKVTGWIKRGWLFADRRGSRRVAEQGGDSYYIPHASVRPFVLTHYEEVDLAGVDRLWFLDLVSGGQIGYRFGGPETTAWGRGAGSPPPKGGGIRPGGLNEIV